jgi:hypothetical protein
MLAGKAIQHGVRKYRTIRHLSTVLTQKGAFPKMV